MFTEMKAKCNSSAVKRVLSPRTVEIGAGFVLQKMQMRRAGQRNLKETEAVADKECERWPDSVDCLPHRGALPLRQAVRRAGHVDD
jgi:hypothetical protein